MVDPEHSNLKWWQSGVIYQVYPRSFQDTNGDGVGDLPGVLKRIDYLAWLGVKAVWISPIYPSPMADFGYDISEYCDVDPLFGSMHDLENLIEALHRRDMKLILDLVPNHTSDQHPWFIKSRSSRDSLRRDWYIWRDPKPDGGPPNNWRSSFGGSAWEWDESTGQYYYHAFDKAQPDLNWRNPEVQEAMFSVMRYWLEKGVDGFRVDVMWHMIKDEHFRDNPPNPDYAAHMSTFHEVLPVYSTDQPEVHEIVRKMREVADSYDDRVIIGEIYLPVERLVTYYGADLRGAHLPFNFQLVILPWDAPQIYSAIIAYEAALPPEGWPNWVLSNHDKPRIVSRVGREQARVAAMLLLSLRGTITVYYGDEIGMRDAVVPWHEIVDPRGRNMPDKNLGRDPQRTPMHWSAEQHAGFTSHRPWLPVDRLYCKVNVEAQKSDDRSMLALYRRLIRLRMAEPALATGGFTPVYGDHQFFAFIRATGSGNHASRFLVLLNFSHRPCYFHPDDASYKGIVEVSTSGEREGKTVSDTIALEADEGLLIRLSD